jgi:hypothetical protein
MAKAAQNNGSGAMLFPSGIDSVMDAPADLMLAIEHCNSVLSWRENLANDEIPPRWMWPFVEDINEWFEVIQMNRDEKSGKDQPDPEKNMLTNSLAKDGVRQR